MAVAWTRQARVWSWVKGLEQLLWFIFLATLAFQARIIVWQADFLFIEWRSASVYASDVLFVTLLLLAGIFWLHGHRCGVRLSRWDYALGLLVAAGLISILGSAHRAVSWIALARLAEGLLLYGYVRWYVRGRFDGDLSLAAFVLGALAQSVLGLAQFLAQQHIGLHMLGETILYPTMRGVAVFYDLAGEKTLRAYGTLPHPNVLAMQLVFALAAVAFLYLRHAAATVRRVTFVWFALVWALLWGLIATFSRTVIAASIGAFSVPFIALMRERTSKRWPNASVLRRRVRDLFYVLLIGSLLFSLLFWPQVLARLGISPHEEAVQLRAYYNLQALGSGDGFLGVNWFGAGIGNFVTWLMESQPHLPAWQYQPAHNLYLLVYTEMGVVGLAGLGLFIFLIVRALARNRKLEPLVRLGLLSLVALVLFTAFFDHFFWTLQQGRLLWWLFWGFIACAADRLTTASTH